MQNTDLSINPLPSLRLRVRANVDLANVIEHVLLALHLVAQVHGVVCKKGEGEKRKSVKIEKKICKYSPYHYSRH